MQSSGPSSLLRASRSTQCRVRVRRPLEPLIAAESLAKCVADSSMQKEKEKWTGQFSYCSSCSLSFDAQFDLATYTVRCLMNILLEKHCNKCRQMAVIEYMRMNFLPIWSKNEDRWFYRNGCGFRLLPYVLQLGGSTFWSLIWISDAISKFSNLN